MLSVSITILILCLHRASLSLNLHGSESYLINLAKKYSEFYPKDDYLLNIFSGSGGILMNLFSEVYDIPFFNFIIQFSLLFLIFCIYFTLAYKITRNFVSVIFSLIILVSLPIIGFGNFYGFHLGLYTEQWMGFLNLRNPKFNLWDYRLESAFFIILSLIFFLSRRYLITAILLGIGFYAHPLNLLNTFIVFFLALLLEGFINKDKILPLLKKLSLMTFIFTLIALPKFYFFNRIFDGVEPISFSTFWDYVLSNEFDDTSAYYNLTTGRIRPSLLLASGSTFIVFLFSHVKIKISTLRILLLIWLPWLWFFITIFYEGTGVYKYFPDFFNDIIMVIHARRSLVVSYFIQYIIISLLFSSLFSFLITNAIRKTRIVFANLLNKKKPFTTYFTKIDGFLKKILYSFEYKQVFLSYILIIILLFPLCYTLIRRSLGSEEFRKAIPFYWLSFYFNFDHQPLEYFYNADNFLRQEPGTPKPIKFAPDPLKEYAYGVFDVSEPKPLIPRKDFIDICHWVKKNTALSDGFIVPTYILKSRDHMERAVFLLEHQDGVFATFNRKMATVFLERFSMVHKGLKYYIGTKQEEDAFYTEMRKRYLDLNYQDIEKIKEKYPSFTYFMTENVHRHKLPYKILYSNAYFSLYSLKK